MPVATDFAEYLGGLRNEDGLVPNLYENLFKYTMECEYTTTIMLMLLFLLLQLMMLMVMLKVVTVMLMAILIVMMLLSIFFYSIQIQIQIYFDLIQQTISQLYQQHWTLMTNKPVGW